MIQAQKLDNGLTKTSQANGTTTTTTITKKAGLLDTLRSASGPSGDSTRTVGGRDGLSRRQYKEKLRAEAVEREKERKDSSSSVMYNCGKVGRFTDRISRRSSLCLWQTGLLRPDRRYVYCSHERFPGNFCRGVAGISKSKSSRALEGSRAFDYGTLSQHIYIPTNNCFLSLFTLHISIAPSHSVLTISAVLTISVSFFALPRLPRLTLNSHDHSSDIHQESVST